MEIGSKAPEILGKDSNGNEIRLYGYPDRGIISQLTNHVCTHYEQL